MTIFNEYKNSTLEKSRSQKWVKKWILMSVDVRQTILTYNESRVSNLIQKSNSREIESRLQRNSLSVMIDELIYM